MPVRRLVAVLSLSLAATGLLGACGGSPTVSVTAGAPAAAAPATGSQLGVEEFAAALRRPNTTILDVRTPEEFAAGHLPGAVNIDVSAPDFADRIGTLVPDAPYAVYCRSGNRSAAAVEQMTAAGFTQVFDLGGGILDWQEAGGEVVTG